MAKEIKLFGLVLEGICYGILGTAFVIPIFIFLEAVSQNNFTSHNSTDISFGDDSLKITIGLAWLLLGLSISAIFWSIVFRKRTDNFFLKWFLILMSSSISPVLLQMAFLIYRNDNSWKLLGVSWMSSLFLMLAPFTFLFANRQLIIEKIQNRRNSLK